MKTIEQYLIDNSINEDSLDDFDIDGRIAQKRKWADIIGDHSPCNGKNLCPACLLFGALGNKYGLKSHVRFTDALPEERSDIPRRSADGPSPFPSGRKM